jgi:hypothetical protein
MNIREANLEIRRRYKEIEMKKLILTLAISLLLVASAFAATGYSFLEIPVGARQSALGGAGVAFESGPTSAAYNPALTAFADHNSVVLMANRHFGDTRAQFFGATLKSKRFAFSPHYWGTRVGSIEFRDAPTRDPISEFDAINSAVGASAAMQLSKSFALGVTGHYLYQKIHIESSDGYAFDAGGFWQSPVKGLSFGTAVNHLGHVSEFIQDEVILPATLRGGAAYERILRGVGTLLVTAEGAGVRDNTPLYRGGVEYRAPQFVALRAGYTEGLESQGVSFGFGLFYSGVQIDYAYVPYKEELGEGHRFSFELNL